MKQTTFHNTTSLSGEELAQRVQRAASQKEAILTVFQARRDGKYTASQVHQAFTNKAGKQWPVTSVRRTLTDLMNEGHLLKLAETRPGPYNDPEHYYMLNHRKHPTQPTANQQNLF